MTCEKIYNFILLPSFKYPHSSGQRKAQGIGKGTLAGGLLWWNRTHQKLAPGKRWYLTVRLIRFVLVFLKIPISSIFLDPSINIESINLSYCNYTLTKQFFLSSLMHLQSHFQLILIWTYLPVAMQYASHLPLGQWINKHFMGRIIPLWLSIYENNISNINHELSQHQDQLTVNYHFY